MKLFLASEAKNPISFPKMEEFVGGFKGKSLAYIPTAANGENPYGTWEKESSTWKLVNTLGARVEPVVLEEFKDARALDRLRNKDIVWMAGGMCGYLMYWLHRCQVADQLKTILESGSIYVGSSAGSMICAPTLDTAVHFPEEPEHGAEFFPGLRLVDFHIIPHFQENQLAQIQKTWPPEKPLYLLKDGEAIIVDNGQIEFFGEKRIVSG